MNHKKQSEIEKGRRKERGSKQCEIKLKLKSRKWSTLKLVVCLSSISCELWNWEKDSFHGGIKCVLVCVWERERGLLCILTWEGMGLLPWYSCNVHRERGRSSPTIGFGSLFFFVPIIQHGLRPVQYIFNFHYQHFISKNISSIQLYPLFFFKMQLFLTITDTI